VVEVTPIFSAVICSINLSPKYCKLEWKQPKIGRNIQNVTNFNRIDPDLPAVVGGLVQHIFFKDFPKRRGFP
jgi:hypothetical protein